MHKKIRIIFLALVFAGGLSARGELLELKPGVTTRGQEPSSWQADLRGKSPHEIVAQGDKLSSRIYSPSEPKLHSPLVIQTDFSEQRIFGFEVKAVSGGGSDLVVKTNGTVLRRYEWPSAGKTHSVNKVIHFPLPAGQTKISFEVIKRGGVVVIDRYLVAQSEQELPANRVAFNSQLAPAATVKEPFKGDVSKPDDGYRGIWFTLGQFSEHGDKYSGGLGTYTANHIPLAVYAPAVNKTFFVYGGTIKDKRHLLIMASYYDHEKNVVPRPTIVHDKNGVNDPHDNPSMNIDDQGHIWVFISGRGRSRPGFKYRSVKPYDVSKFEFISEEEFTYPQPWFAKGKGFFHLFTKYTAGRELYWKTSADGVHWSEDKKLAGLEGHYQVSNLHEESGRIGTFFNRHPGHSVDRRTDLYYMETPDWGKTWTTAAGKKIEVPLTNPDNDARVIEYSAKGKLMYTIDLRFDLNGYPVLLYIVSNGYKPGPENDPREWTITKWNGNAWETYVVCKSDHNYDYGSLFIGENEWTIIGPTEPGPQPYGTGGDIAIWSSRDEGKTWSKKRQVTSRSEFNHTYMRRPLHAKDPFYVFWADGDPGKVSRSRLYFMNSDGTRWWQLPYDMEGEFASPIEMIKR